MLTGTHQCAQLYTACGRADSQAHDMSPGDWVFPARTAQTGRNSETRQLCCGARKTAALTSRSSLLSQLLLKRLKKGSTCKP